MKILFVAMSESIHTQRWISQIAQENWDLRLFPSIDYGYSHQELKNIKIYHTFYGRSGLKNSGSTKYGIYVWLDTVAAIFRKILFFICPNYQVIFLAIFIKLFKPDIIHAMEMQHAGYLISRVKASWKGEFPPLLISLWGSDIYYFQHDKSHLQNIKAVLKQADYILCESKRDGQLAIKNGANKNKIIYIHSTGGLRLNQIKKIPRIVSSKRKDVVIKGYQGWSGNALAGVKALDNCGEALAGYRLVLYSTEEGSEVYNSAYQLANKYGLKIKLVKSNSSHREVLKMYAHARISLNISLTDGVPNSLLESMALGTFPIQSTHSAADEWVKEGESAFLVEPTNIDLITQKITQALKSDKLVDSAAKLNWSTISKRLDYKTIAANTVKMYMNIRKYGKT